MKILEQSSDIRTRLGRALVFGVTVGLLYLILVSGVRFIALLAGEFQILEPESWLLFPGNLLGQWFVRAYLRGEGLSAIAINAALLGAGSAVIRHRRRQGDAHSQKGTVNRKLGAVVALALLLVVLALAVLMWRWADWARAVGDGFSG